MEHLQEVHAENYNEVQQMRIALAIAQSEYSKLESSATGVTNAQAEELASLRNQSTEEISVVRQRLAFAEQHAMNSEQQIHVMQLEVIAHNNERARIAEQSRHMEAAARQANDIQEDKIKILSGQMQELIARLDQESRHRARLEAGNADLRARSELHLRPVHIGTPPGLPDTNRESTGGDGPFRPPLPPEGVVSVASDHANARKNVGPPGGEPPKGPDDDDDGDDDDSDDDHRRRKGDRKKKKKDKRRKKSRGRRRRRSPSSPPPSSSSSSRSSSSSSSGGKFDKKAVKKLLKALTGAASSSKDDQHSDKPRVKEAEKIVFPAFPNHENYRNWRLKAREAVVAASDRTDKAFEWLSAAWNKDKTVELRRDPEGFATLDAKILSAVTNIVSGDFARQVDTFKEREAHHDRLVRGRQVLLMMDKYFSTNALHGSVYDIEDLLSVTMVNEKLEVFMRNWDTVLSGIKKLPEESFLEPIFQRQIKKARVLQHDLNIYERALEGTPERTYRFLYDAAFRYIGRKRTDRNRERIYQSVGGKPSPGVPAPPSKKYVPKGFCISYVGNGSCKKDGCKYKHEIPEERGRPRSKSRPSRPPLVRIVQARAQKSPGSAAFTSKADATRGTSASSSTLGNQAQLRHLVQGVASPGVKGEARAVGAGRIVPDVPVVRVPERAKAALKDPRARVPRGTTTSLGFQPPSVS